MIPESYNLSLVIGGVLSVIAGLLHLGIIIRGARWYRFFGAGEKFARAAERGERWPDVLTFGIALVLFVWGLYAFSGGGLMPALPFLKLGLVAITTVYLARGLLLLPMLIFAPRKVTPFVVWSSVICLGYGVSYLVGTLQRWNNLTT